VVALAGGACERSSAEVDQAILDSQEVVVTDSVAISMRRMRDTLTIDLVNLGSARVISYAAHCPVAIVATRGGRIVWDQRQMTRFCFDVEAAPFVEAGATWTVRDPLPPEVIELEQDVVLHAAISILRSDEVWVRVR